MGRGCRDGRNGMMGALSGVLFWVMLAACSSQVRRAYVALMARLSNVVEVRVCQAEYITAEKSTRLTYPASPSHCGNIQVIRVCYVMHAR